MPPGLVQHQNGVGVLPQGLGEVGEEPAHAIRSTQTASPKRTSQQPTLHIWVAPEPDNGCLPDTGSLLALAAWLGQRFASGVGSRC